MVLDFSEIFLSVEVKHSKQDNQREERQHKKIILIHPTIRG